MVKMRAVIEKEIALIMHQIVLLMHKHIIVRQLIYFYKTFALFTRGLFKS